MAVIDTTPKPGTSASDPVMAPYCGTEEGPEEVQIAIMMECGAPRPTTSGRSDAKSRRPYTAPKMVPGGGPVIDDRDGGPIIHQEIED